MAATDTTGQTATAAKSSSAPGYDISKLKRLHAQAKQSRTRFEGEWYLNLAFFLGRQWLSWKRGRLDQPRLQPWRRMPVDNRIMPIVTSRAARKVKNRPAFVVTPNSASQTDIDASKLGEKVLEADWVTLNLSDRLFNAQMLCEIMGAGFWKVYWDSAAGEAQDFVYENGQPFMPGGKPINAADAGSVFPGGAMPEGYSTQPIARGDVCVELISPLELYPDPLATTMDDCEWVIEEKIRSPDYVMKRFGKTVAPDAAAPTGPVESRLYPSVGGQESGNTSYKGVRVMELWHKPSSESPKGHRCVWAGEQILAVDMEPADPMPYVMFSGIRTPGRFWPTAITTHLRGPQVELNKLSAQVAENAAKFGNPALLRSRQANVTYNGMPGEVIEFDSTVPDAAPAYLQSPVIPQYVIEQMDRATNSLVEISGLHEVSNATVPSGVTAASAINLLQEADDTRIGPEIQDMESRLSEGGTKILQARARYTDEERFIKIAGEDGDWDIEGYRKQMLGPDPQVDVQAGSALPRSKAAKQAAMLEILNLAFQYGLNFDPRDLRRFFKDYEVAALDRLFGGLSRDESVATSENREFFLGVAKNINDYDDHEMHIEVHNDARKSPRYERADPAIQKIFYLHVTAHQEYLAQKTNQQLQAQSVEGQAQQAASLAERTTPAGGLNNPSGSPTTTGG